MGKNYKGGNKQKSCANKADRDDCQQLRVVENPDEKYAIVTKVLGAGMFQVTYLKDEPEQLHQLENKKQDQCESESDSLCQLSDFDLLKTSIAHIRGNMRGKHKRNNFVALHSIILIQLRSFETNAKNSDIIHIYNHNQTHLLPIQNYITHIITPNDDSIKI